MFRRLPSLFILLTLFLVVYFLKNKQPQKKPVAPMSISLIKDIPKTKSINSTLFRPNTPTTASTSLLKMTHFLRSSVKSDLSMTLKKLQFLKTEPSYFQNTTPQTGTLHVVRTEKPLPGTRYFHAQYFSSPTQKPFLQHMSFEIPPGPKAFREAAESIHTIFEGLRPPRIQKDGFILWPWKGGYNVWIQRLDKEEIKNSPFNAYTDQDTGTIRVALEMDIAHSTYENVH